MQIAKTEKNCKQSQCNKSIIDVLLIHFFKDDSEKEKNKARESKVVHTCHRNDEDGLTWVS